MKKQIALFLGLAVGGLFVSNKSYGQDAFEQGNKIINAGIGLNTGTNLIGTFDYALSSKLSVGAGIWNQSIKNILGTNVNASNANLLLRGAYHFADDINLDRFDLYGGVEVAFGLSSGAGTHFALLPGARYFISNGFGAFAELPIYFGGGLGTPLRLGLTFKLK